eukprot:scaffold265099_cov46-Prasinocladus_malaysianus.AAC.2
MDHWFDCLTLCRVCHEQSTTVYTVSDLEFMGCQALETEYGLSAHCFGIDISALAVRLAAKRHRQVSFAVANCFSLPFENNTFDCVVTAFSPWPPAEFKRVLKPGGFVVAAGPGPEHLNGLKARAPNKETNQEKKNFDKLVMMTPMITSRYMTGSPMMNASQTKSNESMLFCVAVLYGEPKKYEPREFGSSTVGGAVGTGDGERPPEAEAERHVRVTLRVSGEDAFNLLKMTPYWWKARPEQQAGISALDVLETSIDVRLSRHRYDASVDVQ